MQIEKDQLLPPEPTANYAAGQRVAVGTANTNGLLEVYSTRETQLAVGVACHGRDDSESAGRGYARGARGGIAKLRRVGEVECLGAEDHAIPIRHCEGPRHAEARVSESRPAKRVKPRRSKAAHCRISGGTTRPRRSLFGHGRVCEIGRIEVRMGAVVAAKNHV
jgi:hypothetical protein